MKRLIYYVATIAALLAAVAACAPELIDTQVPEIQQGGAVVTYTANVEGGDTKVVLENMQSKWKGEEWIQIVGHKGNYWFNSSSSSPSLSTTFTYNGGNGDFDESSVFAVYPAGGHNYGKDFEEMTISNVVVPANQTPVAGSFDPNAAVAVAYTSGNTLNFKNVVALLKFTMGSDNVKNVTIYGDISEEKGGGTMPDYYQDGNVYVVIDPLWLSDGARFAAYFWGDGSHHWRDLAAVTGEDNMFSCAIPAGCTNVIFCRMNPSSDNQWGSDGSHVWNQTVDLNLSDGQLFTIDNPWNSAADNKATGSWTDLSGNIKLGISGTGTVWYNNGNPVMKGAGNNYVSMTGDFVKGQTYYMAIIPTTFEKGFTMEFSNVGDYDKYAVKSTSKKVTFERNGVYNLGVITSGKDVFYTDPSIPSANEAFTIYYKPAEGDEFYSHTGDLYAHIWLKAGAEEGYGPEWGDNSDKYRLKKVSGERLWSMTISNPREYFGSGTFPIQKVGIIARNSDGSKQTADNYLKVDDPDYGYETVLPAGVQHGINYIDDSTVTLVLYDRDNQGKPHDFCNLLWDENWWGDRSGYPKEMTYDDETGCWWITLTGLDADKQYKFQYQLGYGKNVTVTTFDPYTEIVYDTHNDKWISSDTYPGLTAEFGSDHYGRASGFVSAFKINRPEYDWKVDDYDIEDKNDLVIYEMLVRDFTDNTYGEGSIKAAMGQLDYLKSLGINAIELMPIQEFDGNDGWGYGNHAYFAMDKAYGTRNDYKAFIDACHQKGIAVILDVVYNHATGTHPYAAMYWDGDKTASNNPWFNVYAPHQWSVYHDWNHSNPMVRDHVKRSLTYLMTEYKIDGFRFDLTKGFTQNSGTEGVYDQSRVDYLKEYNAHIQWVDDSAVMICEHFIDDENYELGKAGIKVWRNMNHPYSKAMKRDMSQADFTGVTNTFGSSGMMNEWQHFGGLVGYMESHDEQRISYEGQWSYDGSSIDFDTRMNRAKVAAAFFLLTPGPKMIWQFGEIGYDISIEDNGRTGKKPCKTAEYMAVSQRKALYDTYAYLLRFRKEYPRFFDGDVNFRWYVGGNEQTGRYMFARSGDGKQFALFGNFGKGTQTIGVQLPEGGNWKQYGSDAVWTGDRHDVQMSEGQFYLLVKE